MQNTGVDSGSGEVRPRLASRFEPAGTPLAAPMEEAPQIETDVEVETTPNVLPRKISPVPEQDQTERAPVQAMNDEPPTAATFVHARRTRDQTMLIPNREQKLVQPDPSETLPVKNHEGGSLAQPKLRPPVQIEDTSQVFPGKMSPESTNLQEVRKFRKETGMDQPSVVPQRAHLSATRSEIDQVIQPKSHQQAETKLQPHDILGEQKNGRPAVETPTVVPEGQVKVIRERIEGPRMETPSQLAGVQSQLVPALPTAQGKPQQLIEESEPQPPTIHVTIGRIEIKASAPGPSPKRGRPASATMSLDEYLRRRQGSER